MRGWLMGLTVAAALAAAGCNEQQKAEKAVVQDSVAAAPKAAELKAADANLTTYAFGPDASKIEFKGAKVTGSHLGGFKGFKGEVQMGEKPETGKIDLTIETATIFADAEKLTGHLRSPDFFDVEKFPTATFKSTSIAPAEGGKYTVTGDLALHGVTKQIAFPASITVADGAVKATSEFAINRKDFEIVYPGMPDDLIRDEVVITLDVNAKK
ncbi:MAG: YceI family protein [Myxococcaceae bacterium]